MNMRPVGAHDSSPAFQRRVGACRNVRPVGTAELTPLMSEIRFKRAYGTRIPDREPATEEAGYYQWSLRDLLTAALACH